MRLEGDRELLAELIGIFLDTAPDLLARVREACSREDAPGLERAAHALKGALSNFGATEAVAAAFAVEDSARQGNAAATRPDVEALEEHLARLTLELRAFHLDHQA